LGELERDFGGVPAEGWPAWLGRRGVAIIPDDLGRDSVLVGMPVGFSMSGGRISCGSRLC
jgi:hypothetical protein